MSNIQFHNSNSPDRTQTQVHDDLDSTLLLYPSVQPPGSPRRTPFASSSACSEPLGHSMEAFPAPHVSPVPVPTRGFVDGLAALL